ncbi:TetR/AcrR family transcriptional regulator [Massilia niastensis]|uniref:TetR/AcrR family transcriptional regulator n=1 Tax=Massilia niastensis TaxID=544911 RepID=UPI00035F1D9B|nr:TetR/AcrR family transcriptional regulator [Massilia niastensis]
MVSPSKREQTHERIVDSAARALRREGFAGVGVAEVMKQAGLTHGGFYAHFDSREALLLEAIQHADARSDAMFRGRLEAALARGLSPLQALLETYLCEEHLLATEHGCVVSALGSEMGRQKDALRDISRQRVERLVRRVAQALPPDAPPGQALAIAGAMVGVLQLARVHGRDAEGLAMLEQARNALVAQYAADK